MVQSLNESNRQYLSWLTLLTFFLNSTSYRLLPRHRQGREHFLPPLATSPPALISHQDLSLFLSHTHAHTHINHAHTENVWARPVQVSEWVGEWVSQEKKNKASRPPKKEGGVVEGKTPPNQRPLCSDWLDISQPVCQVQRLRTGSWCFKFV